MIGWLQGRLAEPWQQANRYGVLLVSHGVGYEVLLSQRHWQQLPPTGSELILHVHHSIRDDAWTLFGFSGRQERDLFRELVAVSGVGPQMGLALLGGMESEELVRAIVQGDLRRLAQAPGVGKRTAERLSVELRQRLQERFTDLLAAADLPGGEGFDADGADDGTGGPRGSCREEVQSTLAALGYEPLEIHRALRAVAGGSGRAHTPEGGALGEAAAADDWIRECLRWLSRAVA